MIIDNKVYDKHVANSVVLVVVNRSSNYKENDHKKVYYIKLGCELHKV